MATAPSSQLEERMCCGVCMEWFNNGIHVPKILPCQHTFCEACIVQSTNQKTSPLSLHCPICRSHHIIPKGGFITNRGVMDIVDEHQKDLTMKNPSSAFKCTKHSNKEAVLVCIDCLDALCSTCVKSSMQIHAKHHLEEVDEAAQALKQKFRTSHSTFEKNLSLLEKSPCSSTELAKAEADIKSLANKIHAETTKWENEQLSIVQKMKSFVDAQEKKKTELASSDNDLNTFLHEMKQNQHSSSNGNDDFMHKLNQRQAEDQSRFDESLQTLLHNLQAEIESINAIQSKYLKKAASVTSAQQKSFRQSIPFWFSKQGAENKVPKQGAENKVPKSTKILYKVSVTNSREIEFQCSGVRANNGDIIAITRKQGLGGMLIGIHERTGNHCSVFAWDVKKIM